jgi:glycosyltransferase involved in cell wall biosynthesis
VYAERQARALAKLGHEVTVLTSRFDPELPMLEQDQGVNIVRVPVAFRLSKGGVMPGLPVKAWRLISEAEIVNVHVPQLEAALIALIAKLQKKPVVMTYHCDLSLPGGLVNRVAGWATHQAHKITASLADVIIQNTRDFAENSSFLKKFMDKLEVIPPPVVVETVSEDEVKAFRKKYEIKPDHKVIGMVARLAAEKGVEFLVQALPFVVKAVPNARVVFVGEYQHVFGEEAYRDEMLLLVSEFGNQWQFLGTLSESEKTAFYHICDVLVLPSINSTESFGMVQVEAMMCGTQVVATDLPGVRVAVQSMGMGKIVPIRDSRALAEAIVQILTDETSIEPDIENQLIRQYAPESIAKAYEAIYRSLLEENAPPAN